MGDQVDEVCGVFADPVPMLPSRLPASVPMVVGVEGLANPKTLLQVVRRSINIVGDLSMLGWPKSRTRVARVAQSTPEGIDPKGLWPVLQHCEHMASASALRT